MTTRSRRIAVGLLLAAATGPVRLGSGQGIFPVAAVIASVVSIEAVPRDRDSVFEFLESYESTLASGRVERIAALYADLGDQRRGEMQRYFESVVRDLEVRLDDVAVVVEGDRAHVAFRRTDRFIDRESGQRIEKEVAIERALERSGESWRIELGRSSRSS